MKLEFNNFDSLVNSYKIISIIFAPVYSIEKGMKIILAMFKNISNFAAQNLSKENT